jgi:hypothetical protein
MRMALPRRFPAFFANKLFVEETTSPCHNMHYLILVSASTPAQASPEPGTDY